MAGWKTKFLNLAGRTTPAKAVLNSIPTHVMQLHKLPSTVTNRIDKIQRNFIWGTTDVKRKLHLIISWDVVTEDKEAGGLGLQKSKTKNDIDISPNCLHCGYLNQPSTSLW
uniref:Reverse transcriptase n=1 Tax=Solanum tuberosum TaxID=4113 RepID=M1CTG1_SOLTU